MRNQGIILAVAISFLVIAFVFIYVSQFYIPSQNDRIAEGYKVLYQNKGVFVVVGDDGLQEGTVITEELFTEKTIQIQNIPANFMPQKNGKELVYTTGTEFVEGQEALYMDRILGKVVKSKIEPGSIITYASLGEGGEVAVDSFKKQIQLKVENTVGENLKTGKYVDIVTKYQNGEYDVVVAKVMVESVIDTGVNYDQENQAANGEQGTPAVTNGVILVSLDDREYRDIELAQRMGKLSIRLYKSVEQYPSQITFDYVARMNEINTSIKEYELEGAHDTYYLDYPMYMTGKKDIDKTSELFIYMEWYADIYYKLKPFFEGASIYEKKEEAEAYRETMGENAQPTITLDELAEYGNVTKLDVLIALIMGNEKPITTGNRLEMFNTLIKDNPNPITGIRITVASQLVDKVLNYYTNHAGTNIDSLAYLIQNGFITTSNFS